MSGMGGLTLDKRQVCVGEGRAASVVATLAEALGYHVARGSGVQRLDVCRDLWVVEATQPEALAPYHGAARLLVVAPRRLRAGEAHRLRAGGAHRVLDTEACLLEVAFALTDLLFETCHHQRRYAEEHGGLAVHFLDDAGQPQQGRLTGIAHRGGAVTAEQAPPDGATVVLTAEVGPWEVPIRGRVAFVDSALKPGFGLEFALDDQALAPRIEAFLAEVPAGGQAPARSASGVLA
jgi:hypothetical protein